MRRTGRIALRLKRQHLNEIVAHCRREAPLEACGLMGGRALAVHRVYLLANQEKSAVNYRIDPREQLRVMKDIWGRGEELVAIFHSHPASPAYPSKTDIELAYYPETVHLIVSLAAEDPSCRVFRIAEGKVGEGSLEII